METHSAILLVHGGTLVLTFVVGGGRDDLVGLALLRLDNVGRLVVTDCLCKGTDILAIGTFQRGLQCIIHFSSRVADTATHTLGKEFLCFHDGALLPGVLLGFDKMLGILIIQVVEDFVVCLQAQVERCPVLLVRGQPSYLRHCQHTRQEAVFHLVNVVTSLCPHVALHAEGKFLLAAQGAQGIEAIYLVHGVHTPSAMIGFVHEEVALLSLHEVDIQVLVGHDDGLKTTVGCLGTEVHAVPCHDDRFGLVVVVPVVQEFVPHDDVLAVLFLKEDTQFLHKP